MLVPNRHGSSESYRYGFQGQEKDDEVKGEGNSLNYTFRMHDTRVGRFFTTDPLEQKYPHYTPYSFSGNKVIHAVELEGLEEYVVTTNTDKRLKHFKVRIDDNLSIIAKTTGVAVSDIIKWNEKTLNGNPDLIYPGQTLVLFDTTGLSMKYFTQQNQSDWLKDFIVELATTNERGYSIQSQVEAVMIAEGGAGLAEVVINSPKIIRAVQQGAKRLNTPKKVPVKEAAPKISTVDDYINPHAYSRHKYDPTKTSSKSKTQYGKNVDVKKVREETMNNPDKIVRHFDEKGNHYATTYKKTFKENLSTTDTPTYESRVIINHLDQTRSTQFPLYQPPK